MTTHVEATPKLFQVTPDTRMLENLGCTGEPAYKAVAELIDNSIDARIPGERVTVRIGFAVAKNRITSITIEDDAGGMNEEGLVSAFRIGRSTKRDPKQIGRFGMGLKTAVSSLGRQWTVTTGTREDRVAHQLSEDLDVFVQNNEWVIKVADVPKILPINRDYGTRVEITKTEHINASTFQKDLTTHLANLFRYFIEEGTLALFVNDELVEVPEVDLREDSMIEFDTEINGKRVYGWMGLRRFGTYEYGFSLVRYNRVIEKNVKIGFAPHPALNRVIGDVHMDDFATNHHKTGFVKTNDDWAAFEDFISEKVKPLLAMARELSNKDRRRINQQVERLLVESIQLFLDAIKTDEELSTLSTTGKRGAEGQGPKPERTKGEEKPKDKPEEAEDKAPALKRPPRRIIPFDKMKLRHEFINDGAEGLRKRWEIIEGELVVLTNMDHPAFPETAGQHSWGLQNVLESVAAYYAQDHAQTQGLEEPTMGTYEQMLDRIYRISAKANLIY